MNIFLVFGIFLASAANAQAQTSNIFQVTRPVNQTPTYVLNSDKTCSKVTLLGYNSNGFPVTQVDNMHTGGSTLVCQNQTQIKRLGTAVIYAFNCPVSGQQSTTSTTSRTTIRTTARPTSNCSNCICTLNYSPVCGSNGMTYSNSCHLDCQKPCVAGLTIRKNGPC